MPAYLNLGGNSNVKSYRVVRARAERKTPAFDAGGLGLEDEAAIEVEFGDGSRYLYTASSAGLENIRKMVALAEGGRGLNGFVNRNVRKLYAKKY